MKNNNDFSNKQGINHQQKFKKLEVEFSNPCHINLIRY